MSGPAVWLDRHQKQMRGLEAPDMHSNKMELSTSLGQASKPRRSSMQGWRNWLTL